MSAKHRTKIGQKTKSSLQDEDTKQEINRQHALLLANLDRKQLRGNVTMEDHRHDRQAASLTQKQRRQRYEITTQKKELLHDIHKVRSSYTGHYDASKSPMENIQQALKTKSQTPAKSTRLSPAPISFAIRRCVSSEVLSRPATSMDGDRRPSTSLGLPVKTTRPKTAVVNSSDTRKNSLSTHKKAKRQELTNV